MSWAAVAILAWLAAIIAVLGWGDLPRWGEIALGLAYLATLVLVAPLFALLEWVASGAQETKKVDRR